MAQTFRPTDSRVLATADPAAGTEFTFTVPAAKKYLLLACRVVLVQGLTQTPQPLLVIDDGTDVVFEGFGSSAAQAASTTASYTWAVGSPLTALIGATPNIRSNGPLPEGVVLLAGWRVRSVTLGIGANSDYGIARLLALELH